ncbi:hypothetical protein M407DRAFT_14100 [Tulasnella calospora MUT 4182]|uniref:Uncharacterized protein n=1 Tax=Tulasnella calospora MUT 4182 TaxID=1051891 RepID=A0A0C3QTC3_9AGAM|nr:hypothetical protein M407DRAFT_14100 [Tulasnella calospora MUT 4182]
MQMLTKFESKSNRVKGLAFHPTRPLLAASLHNGSVQLWNYQMGTLVDRFDEHDGPVRGVAIHPTRPLLVTGGDDYKVKVWDIRPQGRKCLFTLHGHLDYVRTVQFHHEMPWIISASDDQTIRIWNSTSRNCIAILTGHSHYIMSAMFHPKEDLVVSASMDQTVRVWDISGLRKGTPQAQPGAFDTFDSFSTVKYVLEGHDRGVNYAAFHPSLPLIVSAGDDRQVKLWRMSETKAWEVDTCRGHFNNVSSALFHPRHELILSVGEDKTIRVWDMSRRTAVQTFRREHDRFWVLTAHPELNLFAAGHDNGLIVFKLERERPAFALQNDMLYYIRDKYVRQYDLNTGSDVGVLSVRKLGSQWVQPRTLSFNPAERAVIVTSGDNGIIQTLEQPVYLTRVKGKTIYCLDRTARPRTINIDPTEYKFKLALVQNKYDEVLNIIRTSNLVGQSIIAYLQKKGFPEIALHFVQDKKTRFELAIECGNLDVALETAKAIDRPESWARLAQQALKQGNHKVVETAYQRTKNFDKLSFLYLSTGSLDKLSKMQVIAEKRGDHMSKFHNALYSGDVKARIAVLRDVGMQPLAYLTAKTNGLEDLAEQILASAGIQESDIEGLDSIGASTTLRTPPVVTQTANLLWPSLATEENFFDKALANGHVADYINGDAAADGAHTLDSWEAGEPDGGVAADGEDVVVEEGEGWDLEEEVVEPDASHLNAAEDVVPEDEGDAAAAAPGVPEPELWARNSPFAADHAAAGQFESAMQLLNRQIGAVSFAPLKPHFMALYRSAHVFFSPTASLDPLQLHIRRDPEIRLPVIRRTLASLKSGELAEGYRFVSAGKLEDAAASFKAILLQLMLVTVTTKEEAADLQDTIVSVREYLLGVSMELERRKVVKEDPTNVRRSLELAAYFAHCKLQPTHETLALRNAISVFTKARNPVAAGKFAKRLIELGPDAKVAASVRQFMFFHFLFVLFVAHHTGPYDVLIIIQARQVMNAGQNGRDTVEISYNDFTDFDVCAASFTPIYKGSPLVKDPFTGACFLPDYLGKLSPLTEVTEIGAHASGLPIPR